MPSITKIEACIKCKAAYPCATPYLCLRCFKPLSNRWRTFILGPRAWAMHEEVLAVHLKNYQNSLQRHCRKATKRIDAGLLAQPNEAKLVQ